MWISLGKFARPYELRTVTSTGGKIGRRWGEGEGEGGRERQRSNVRFPSKERLFFGSDPRSILKSLMKER